MSTENLYVIRDGTTVTPHPAAVEFERRRLVSQAKLTAHVVEWFLADSESLVMDVEEPVQIHRLFEDALAGDVEARKLLAKYVALAAHAGVYPRGMCRCCWDADCRGCGGESTDITPPARIANLVAEVRRA